MNEFSKTQMGRKFFERDVPAIADGLKKTVEILDKGIKTMEEIARELRNKRTREDSKCVRGGEVKYGWKLRQDGDFSDKIIFVSRLEDMTSYAVGKCEEPPPDGVSGVIIMRYFLYVNGKHVPNKSVDSFSRFYEVLEAIADEAGLD